MTTPTTPTEQEKTNGDVIAYLSRRIQMLPPKHISEQAKEMNIEPLLQLMEEQSEMNTALNECVVEQQEYIDKLEKRINRDRLVQSEKRMIAVTVALCFSVLFSTLFNLFTHY